MRIGSLFSGAGGLDVAVEAVFGGRVAFHCEPEKIRDKDSSPMGWPAAGWVTDVPGIGRNDALRIIGNGVVPAQAATALRWLLSVAECAA